MPLFERAETERRPPANMAGAGFCPVHPHSEAVARCKRCTGLLCGICRTRWQDEILCLGCFNQALENKELAPNFSKLQERQARWSLIWTIAGWMLGLGALFTYLSLRDAPANQELRYLALGLFLVSFLPALLGLGLSFAVVRARGRQWMLASWCFVLTALQVGLSLGLIIINVTHN